MTTFAAVRKQLRGFYFEEHQKELQEINKPCIMTYRILKALDPKANTLDILFIAEAAWGLKVMIGSVEWKNSMYDWRANQWSYFILEILIKCKIKNPMTDIKPSYKIQKSDKYENYVNFTKQLHSNVHN